MRILHVADLHFRKSWFDWLSAQAGKFDAVCVAGDLLNLWKAREVSLHAQAKWVRQWARERFGGRLFVCSGNHDWWPSNEMVDTDAEGGWLRKLRRPAVSCDNDGSSIDDVFFYCHPYATRGQFPHIQTKHWVLLHHEPPSGCTAAVAGPTETDLGNRYLCEELTATSRPPLFVLSGHVHHPKSWRGRCNRSWVLNPCYDEESQTPNRIIVDLTSGVVTWITERHGEWPLKLL